MKKEKKTWRDVSLGQWQRIEAARKAATSEEAFVYDCVAILYGVTAEEIQTQPLADTIAMAEGVSFLNTPPKPRLVRRHYDLGGTQYRAFLNPREITTSQYIDFQSTAGDAQMHPERMLSCLLVPVGYSYAQGYDVEEAQIAIREHMSIVEVVSLTAFFLTLSKKLIKLQVSGILRECRRTIRQARKEGLTIQTDALMKILEAVRHTAGYTRCRQF